MSDPKNNTAHILLLNTRLRFVQEARCHTKGCAAISNSTEISYTCMQIALLKVQLSKHDRSFLVITTVVRCVIALVAPVPEYSQSICDNGYSQAALD